MISTRSELTAGLVAGTLVWIVALIMFGVGLWIRGSLDVLFGGAR